MDQPSSLQSSASFVPYCFLGIGALRRRPGRAGGSTATVAPDRGRSRAAGTSRRERLGGVGGPGSRGRPPRECLMGHGGPPPLARFIPSQRSRARRSPLSPRTRTPGASRSEAGRRRDIRPLGNLADLAYALRLLGTRDDRAFGSLSALTGLGGTPRLAVLAPGSVKNRQRAGRRMGDKGAHDASPSDRGRLRSSQQPHA